MNQTNYTHGQMAMSKCPKEGCETMKRLSDFACRKHWFQLPQSLRTRIWRAFATMKTKEGLQKWKDAAKEADDFWKSKDKVTNAPKKALNRR